MLAKLRFIKHSHLIFLVLLALIFSALPHKVYAAELLNRSNTMSSLRANTLSNHFFLFRSPSGAQGSGAADTITITFPAGFTMGTFALLNFDLGATAGGQSTCTPILSFTERTLAGTNGVDTWGVSQAGQVVTFTAPSNVAGTADIAANACIRVRIGNNAATGGAGVNQITNPVTPNPYTIAISGNAGFGNFGNIVVTIINNDQVSLSASVPETLTFSISDDSIGFGALSATESRFATGDTLGNTAETEAHNIIVGTNASSGYGLTLNGATLASGANTIAAIGASNTAPAFGTAQFGLRANVSGSGSGAVVAPYQAAGFAFDTAAFPDQLATAAGPTANNTFSMRYLANIPANQPAGAYTSVLTFTATANF